MFWWLIISIIIAIFACGAMFYFGADYGYDKGWNQGYDDGFDSCKESRTVQTIHPCCIDCQLYEFAFTVSDEHEYDQFIHHLHDAPNAELDALIADVDKVLYDFEDE